MAAKPHRDGHDKILHDRIRLGIVSALAATENLTFSELKELLDATDGNLSVHARKLEDAEYIESEKVFERRKPRTDYVLTPKGRRALEDYLKEMEAVLRVAREALKKK